MKKIIIALICFFLLPIMVFATTKEDIITKIKEIENTNVSEDMVINNTEVTDNEIIFHFDEELLKNRYEDITEVDSIIPYHFEEDSFIFDVGLGKIETNSINIEKENTAFYLYLILYNQLDIIYNQEDFLNTNYITNKIQSISKEELIKKQDITFFDEQNIFGVKVTITDPDNLTFKYSYVYNYTKTYIPKESDSIINHRETPEVITDNPYTRNLNYIITIMIIIVGSIGIYTYLEKKV